MIGLSDPLARQGFSRSAGPTDSLYAYVALLVRSPGGLRSRTPRETAFMNNPG